MEYGYKETYHKYGEIYLSNQKDYAVLCCHCHEMFYEFEDFRNHTLIHTDNSDLKEAEMLSADSSEIDKIISGGESDNEYLSKYNLIETNEMLYEEENMISTQEIKCPHCKTSFKPHEHDLVKCSEIQMKIIKYEQNIEKLFDDGIYYVCTSCTHKFMQFNDLYDHHKIEKHCSLDISCAICVLFNKTNLVSKTGNVNDKDEDPEVREIFQSCSLCCKYCNRKFKSQYYLDKHEKLHEENKLKCQFCNKIYGKPYRLSEHIKRSHSENRPYKCKLCSADFRAKINLKKHIVFKHTDERPFICDVEGCSSTFKLLNLKREHERRHFSKKPHLDDLAKQCKIQCEICGKIYESAAGLNRHKLRLHTSKESWPYQCKICNRKFSQKKNLTDHSRRHTGEKPFGCDVCPRFFARLTLLNQHRRFHDDVTKLICNICGKVFGVPIFYKNHMKRHLENIEMN